MTFQQFFSLMELLCRLGKMCKITVKVFFFMILFLMMMTSTAESASRKLPAPEFGQVNRNITAQLSSPAYLDCIVNKLEDRTVSWIRARDFHVLTIGTYRYTTDERFEVIHNETANLWTLKIIYTNLTDIGAYECQVSSDPKVSFSVALNVVVSIARIIDAPDFYIQSGSKLQLICQITQCYEDPKYVLWYHNEKIINYDSNVKVRNLKAANGIYNSILYIDKSTPSNSGNYSCIPANANPATITVHVLNGQMHAAIQESGSKILWESRANMVSAFTAMFSMILWTIFSYVHER